MDFSVSYEAMDRANKLAMEQAKVDYSNSESGFSSLKKGQLITATVTSVGEEVTLEFQGEQVTASKSVIGDVNIGDSRTFEVVKVEAQEIELRLHYSENRRSRASFKAVYMKTTDREIIESSKEIAARKVEKELEYKEVKDKLEDISTKFTELDYYNLEREGFSVESFTIQGLDKAINRVKSEETSKGSKNTKNINADESNERKKADRVKATHATEAQKNKMEELIKDKLIEENLPATHENIAKVSKALELCTSISRLDAQGKHYLISKEVKPTPENLYKASYSSKQQTLEKLDDSTWSALQAQAAGIIREAGYGVNQANLEEARWIIESKLPLTVDTYRYKKDLDQLKDLDVEHLLDHIVEGMKEGTNPKDVPLINSKVSDNQISENHKQLLTDIQAIRPETITKAIETDTELTIRKLITLQQSMEAEGEQEQQASSVRYTREARSRDEAYKVSTARNEEIRTRDITDEVARVNTARDEAIKDNQNPKAGATTENVARANSAGDNVVRVKTTGVEILREAGDSRVRAVRDEAIRDNKNLEAREVSDNVTRAENSSEFDPNDNDAGDEETSQNLTTRDSLYEEIKARRQLEEIRLKMTLEVASKLEGKGFKIETESLEKVVDALRELENKYYVERLKEADVEVTEASINTLRETTESITRLAYMPSYVLGSTLAERNTLTIPGLLEEGGKLQAELVKAGAAYETLMTVPNPEYGDSIKKAFANADSLLAELNLENTEANQRAVRILGYNQMEITEESIQQVKAYDMQVSTLIKNLHPAVTVRMIKEGINPLEMSINELNQTIDRIKEEQGITSEEKYSTFLRRLEKTEGISEEDRKAYIGIYRLLYNIEKSDGAALGAVIKAGQEVSLDNLLTAIRTHKKGRLDAVIDDEFGTLEGISKGKESIADQLQGFIHTSETKSSSADHKIVEQTEYYNLVIKELKENITPEKLKKVGQEVSQTVQSTTTYSYGLSTWTAEPSGKGIWETIKRQPVEKLYEKLQNIEDNQEIENKIYEEKLQEIRELCRNSEQSIRFLNDYHLPSTPLNITMANYILSNSESPIKKLLKLQTENIVEKTENSLKEINNISDTLIDKNSMEEVYRKLDEDAKAALKQSYSEEKIDSQKLAELKTLGQQINFLKVLSEKEFYQIPIETKQGVTNVNLTIVRGTQTSGKVAITMQSDRLGNLKAEFSLKGNNLKGYISSDNRSGLELLQENSEELIRAAEDATVNIKQLDYVLQHRDNETYSYHNSAKEDSNPSENRETERILYRIAKAVVQTVRTAEAASSHI